MFKNKFQLGVLIVFGFAAVIGLIIISTKRPQNQSATGITGHVSIWGSIPSSVFRDSITAISEENDGLTISYRFVSEDNFDRDLLENLAVGTGPDLFVMTDQNVIRHSNKVFPIPFENLPLTSLQQSFVDQVQLFVNQDGVLAFPVMIDPLVMYYNKNILVNNFLLEPPRDWDSLLEFAQVVTSGTPTSILTSAVALGTYANIDNAKDILAMMLLQSGNSVVEIHPQTNLPLITLNTRRQGIATASEALEYYSSYANPNNAHHSWNTSFDNSKDVFANENLAVYFGFASEVEDFGLINPNLNFGVAQVPQFTESSQKVTLGRVYGLAISNASQNIPAAFTVGSLLMSERFAPIAAANFQAASVLRNQLAPHPEDEEYQDTVKKSAIIARSWYDPDPALSNNIFRDMVRSYNSGLVNTQGAIDQAENELRNLVAE